MVEELQIRTEYRSSGVIVELWKFFICNIPEDALYIEAYADAENHYSQKLLGKLGLYVLENTADGELKHFRGDFKKIRNR